MGGGERLRCNTRATKIFTARELGGTVPIEVRRCLVIPDMGINVLPVSIFAESGCEIGVRRTRHGETQMRIDRRGDDDGGGPTIVARLIADATGLFKLNRPRAEQAMAAIALDQGDAAMEQEDGDDTESDEGEALALKRLAVAVRGQLLRVGCRPQHDDSGDSSDSDEDEERPGGGPSVGGRTGKNFGVRTVLKWGVIRTLKNSYPGGTIVPTRVRTVPPRYERTHMVRSYPRGYERT